MIVDGPRLALVPGNEEDPVAKPLTQQEAELMAETVAWLRPRLSMLPPTSPLRRDWLEALDDVALAARLQWPQCSRPAAVGQ